MATAYDIVVGALQLCKAYAVGEAPPASYGQLGLRVLNAMRATWNAEGVACFGLQELSTAADGAQSYTIGASGDIVGRVLGVRSVVVADGTDTYAPDQITLDEYDTISDKAQTGVPVYWAQKQGDPFTVYLWPCPTSGTVKIRSRALFQPIANLSDDIPEPDEYLETMEAMLALRLADRFASDAGASTAALAASGYEALRARANSQPPPILSMDEALTGTVYIDHDTETR